MKSVIEEISEKMFSYVGLTINDVKNNPALFLSNKLTWEQYLEWYNWSEEKLSNAYPTMSHIEILKVLDLFDIKFGLLYNYIKPEVLLSDEIQQLLKEAKPPKKIKNK